MPKIKNGRPVRERTSLTLNPALKCDLDNLHEEYKDRHSRLRSDIIDTGIRIVNKIIKNYGTSWFYDNKDILPDKIFELFEDLKR